MQRFATSLNSSVRTGASEAMTGMQRTADVVVVGGGVIGLSIAWRLARAGLGVCLLERGAVARGASWAAPGVLAAGNWQRSDPLVQFQRASLRMYPAFCAEAAEASGIDPEYANSGSLELLFHEQQFRMAQVEVDAAASHCGFRDEPVLRLLTPCEARAVVPGLSGESLGVKLCTFSSQVRTPRLLRALRAAATAAGASIVEGCTVLALRREGERVVGVCTSHGDLGASETILCAGAWSGAVDADLAKIVCVYPVRGQVVLLRDTSPTFSHIIKHRKVYLVPRTDGHIVLGSTEERESGFNEETTAEGIASILTQAQHMVPPIGRMRFVKAWAGLRPATPDRRPFLGRVPGLDGLLVATGHFRTGVGLAPLTASLIADWVLEGRPGFDVTPFLPGRALREMP